MRKFSEEYPKYQKDTLQGQINKIKYAFNDLVNHINEKLANLLRNIFKYFNAIF